MTHIIFFYCEIAKVVGRSNFRSALNLKPNLGFEYDEIFYDSEKDNNKKVLNLVESKLSETEISLIKNFANSYNYLIWKIDEKGKCIGQGNYNDWPGKKAHCAPPPNPNINYWYNEETQNWDYVYGVDESGKYLGNVEPYKCKYFANVAPPSSPNIVYVWDKDKKEWVDSRTFEELKAAVKQKFVLEKIALYMGEIWNINEESLAAINAVTDTNITFWKNLNNEDVRFHGYTFIELRDFLNNHAQEQNNYYQKIMNEIDATTTKEELYNLKFDYDS